MNIEEKIERIIQISFLNYFRDNSLVDLSGELAVLKSQGFQFGLIESISGDIIHNHLKRISIPSDWSDDLIIGNIIEFEKKAAIYLQQFEYAAKVRDLELHFRHGKNSKQVLKFINPYLEFCIFIKSKTIYFYLHSELCQFEANFRKLILFNDFKENHSKVTNQIFEQFFFLLDNDDLATIVRDSWGQHWKLEYEKYWCYLIYCSKNKPFEINCRLYETPEKFKPPKISFLEQLNQLESFDYNLLNLLILYFFQLEKPLNPYLGIKNPVLDALLVESCGWLAYQHQLELLFCMATGQDFGVAVEFVKNFNKKKHDAFKDYLDVPFMGSTLCNIMTERLLSDCVLRTHGSVQTAYRLYNTLNQPV